MECNKLEVKGTLKPDPETGTFTLQEYFTPSITFIGGINEQVLQVAHGGEFKWHENADAMIEDMRGGSNQASMHILMRLRAYEQIAKSLTQVR